MHYATHYAMVFALTMSLLAAMNAIRVGSAPAAAVAAVGFGFACGTYYQIIATRRARAGACSTSPAKDVGLTVDDVA